MAKVAVTQKFNGTAADVWKIIGGFHTLPNFHPAIEKSVSEERGNDIIRHLHLRGGAGVVVERLEASSNAERFYTYSILEAPMPVRNYVATIRVLEDDNGKSSLGHWVADFDVVGGEHAEKETVEMVTGVFSSGFSSVASRFGK